MVIKSQVPDIDAVLVCISGGGLLSGVATAVKARKPSVRLYAVEPAGKNLAAALLAHDRAAAVPNNDITSIEARYGIQIAYWVLLGATLTAAPTRVPLLFWWFTDPD